MLKLAQTDRPTDRPTDRAKTIYTKELTCSVQPKFHEDPPCGHVFQQTRTIFKLIQDIIKTNLTKFYEDWTINVTFKSVKTVFIRKNFLPTGSHFHEDQTINVTFTVLTSQPKPYYLLIQDIKYSDKFHEDWTINVTFGVLTSFYYSHTYIIGTILLTKSVTKPNGCHVFQPTRHIIEFAQVIIRTNLLTNFMEIGQ
ncbi:hypothetical protein DPMN_003658 [Dreissena polymorpha]|uniref:Uncharacterized protein n=1 Tax=Dreissena polymorpha TaxID=45954 RepID=A0A9D4RV53_DREPO|nr:hypothetical protein DPMN_003658 [Dreissena polymorpha]